MASFDEYTDFEMDEIPEHSGPQTLFEPLLLSNTSNQSQYPAFLPQGQHIPMDGFDDIMAFSRFPPQEPFDHPALHVNGNLIPPYSGLAKHWQSFRHNDVLFQAQDSLPVNNPPQSQHQPSQSPTRKRAPKAPTMSAKRWKPCESLIKQLYVHEGKSINELREIINKEFGLTATERQYKAKIQQMKLERNVKVKERGAVIRQIQYRAHAIGKKCSYVRVRGHKINLEKLSRWMKEAVVDQPSTSTGPPSPLPSCISIYTNSPCGSPKLTSSVLLEHQRSGIGTMSSINMESDAIQRILKYAQAPKHIIRSQEARAVFNDLQLILSCNHLMCKIHPDHPWNPNAEEDIIRVRNLMNVTHGLTVKREWNGRPEMYNPISAPSNQNLETNQLRGSRRHASWMTSYGRVYASFWSIPNGSYTGVADENAIETFDRTFAAKVAIVPSDSREASFRVVFDATPHLDPTPTITYQAMIPNDSEIFKIVASGQVEKLLEALENGTASLTDRDEQGRSLINYAFYYSRADICKFLVDRNADVNGFEMDLCQRIGPIHIFEESLHREAEEEERRISAYCMKILLEAGADTSLESYWGGGIWVNTFMSVVISNSVTTLKHVLDLGEPFISPNGIYKDFWGKECSPLTALATSCGYAAGEVWDIAEKAILLLERKADISCRYYNGDTVLHTVLKCRRLHQYHPKRRVLSWGELERWKNSFKAPKDLLIIFISAGADVYAANNRGETPSMVASKHGRDEEWIEALTLCGYDSEEVMAQSDPDLHDCTRERQTSKLSFEECCQQWRESLRFEEVETDDEDEDEDEDDYEDEDDSEGEDDSVEYGSEGTETIAESTECGNGNLESPPREECTVHGMNLGLEDPGGNDKDEFTGETGNQAVEPGDGKDNCADGMDLDFNVLFGGEIDITEELFDFDNYLDAPL